MILYIVIFLLSIMIENIICDDLEHMSLQERTSIEQMRYIYIYIFLFCFYYLLMIRSL